jgi:hypothetical protein
MIVTSHGSVLSSLACPMRATADEGAPPSSSSRCCGEKHDVDPMKPGMSDGSTAAVAFGFAGSRTTRKPVDASMETVIAAARHAASQRDDVGRSPSQAHMPMAAFQDPRPEEHSAVQSATWHAPENCSRGVRIGG